MLRTQEEEYLGIMLRTQEEEYLGINFLDKYK